MSSFSGKELNAWRLTKRESRLFAPDSLKFHSFVVEAGSQLRCGRKGSPHAAKSRRGGRVAVPRQLTYCGCHVENVNIASAVRLCSGGDGCIPDCGCRFGENSGAAAGSVAFVSRKDHQVQRTPRTMKRRASSVPRPRKVLKVSVRQAPVTQNQNSVDTVGLVRLQPSATKDCGVAVPSDSHSETSKEKRGNGKLPADRSPLFRKPSVHLWRLPAEVVECYLSRPTVVLSKLCDRLHQCQKASRSQESPVTSPRSPGKRFKPDAKPEELERKDTRVSEPSTQDGDAGAVGAHIRGESAQEDASVTPTRESRLRSKSEPRPEDSERRKKSSSDLKAVDNSKSSSTNSLSADSSRKSAQKESPVTSPSESRTRSKSEPRPETPGKRRKSGSDASPGDKSKSSRTNSASVADTTKSPQKDASATPTRESRLRSKSEPRPEDSERQKKSSSDLKAVDKSKSSSTNSLSADSSRKSAQKEAAVTSENDSRTHSKSEPKLDDPEKKKRSSSGPATEGKAEGPGGDLRTGSGRASAQVTRQAVANQNALSPASNLRSKASAKVESLLVTRKRFRKSGEGSSESAKDIHSKSTSAGTYKAEEQVRRKRSTTVEVIVSGTREEVKSPATDKLKEQISCHPVTPTRHSTSSASALAKCLELKSPIKPGDLFAEGMNYSALLKVDRLPELTNNNRSTVTANESVHESCSPASAGLLRQTAPEVMPFKRTRGRQRHGGTGCGQPVGRPQHGTEAGLSGGDDNPALEAYSPASAVIPQRDLETTPEAKTFKRIRGRPTHNETRSQQSADNPEGHIEEGVISRENNSSLQTHSPASPGKCHKDFLTTPEEKSLKRKRGRSRRDETDSGHLLERANDRKEDKDQNLAMERAPVTSPSAPGKRFKPDAKAEQLERKSTRSSDPNIEDQNKSRNRETVGVNINTRKKAAQEESSATSVPESRRRSKTESRPEDFESRKRSSGDLTIADKSKSSSTNCVNRKSPKKEVPVTSPRESRTRSKSEPKPEGLEKRKSSSTGVKREDNVERPRTGSDRATEEKMHSRPSGESSKSASKREDSEKKKSRDPNLKAATEDHNSPGEDPNSNLVAKTPERRRGRTRHKMTQAYCVACKVEHHYKDAVTDGARRSSRTETSGNKTKLRSKSEPRPEDERRKKSSSDLKAVDKSKSSSTNSPSADGSRKSAQKEAPVTSPTEPRRRSKSEPRAEALEKRTRSSSGPRTEGKVRSPAANSAASKSPQKEAPVTLPTGPQRRSKSEPRAEGLGKRTRSSSGPRTEDKVRSPAANSASSKSPQKEAPAEPRRRSKSEPRAEGLGKRTRSSSGPRTEDKVKSPAANSISAANARKKSQKESVVTPTGESRRRAKSAPSPEGTDKRRSGGLRAEDKLGSPAAANSVQKETPTRESRRHSKSAPGLERSRRSSSDLRTEENVGSPNRGSVAAPDGNRKAVGKESAASSGSGPAQLSKSPPTPKALEKKNRRISNVGTQVVSPSGGIVNGDIDSKSAQEIPPECRKKTSTQYFNDTLKTEDCEKEKLNRNDCDTEINSANEKLHHKSETGSSLSDRKAVEMPSSGTVRSDSPVHSKLGFGEERWKKRLDVSNESWTQTTVLNGDEEYNSTSHIFTNEKSTHRILPKALNDLSVHSEKIEHRHPVSKLLNKIPSKLERLKAKRHNSNKPRDVFPTSPYHGDSHVRTPQKVFESLAPSPSCRSMRSILSESLTSLNSFSSEGTEIESPAYEPLGSSPICIQNLRDDPEEFQKTKVISPSCRSDCCTLRQSQGSTTSPSLKVQTMSKAAIRRLSDVFDALPPAPAEGGTANRQAAEEQRHKCLAAVEEDGNATPCHEVDSSFFEEWSKSVREADQVAKSGFVAKYSKRSVDLEATSSRLSTPIDGGKQLISPQKLGYSSPTNQKPHNIAVKKQVLLGWEPLQSPSNCEPSCETDDTVVLDINDCDSSDSEEDCVITDIRPRSSLSTVISKTPPPHPREDPNISTKVMQRRNLGKSLIDVRPEQQMYKPDSSTVKVDCDSSPKKWQLCNTLQFLGSTSSQCHCRPKDNTRRCRSASPRLHYVASCPVPEEDEDDDDDDDCVPCDATTISRLQQINERIQLVETSTLPLSPLWRHKGQSNALHLEDGAASKAEAGGDEEDSGDRDDSDESVIVLDEPDRCFSPKSPSCPPPDLEVKRLSPARCGSLTVENVAKHNRCLDSGAASLSLSVRGVSDLDGGESLRSFTRSPHTPRSVSLWESSFADASTAGLNGVSHCTSLATQSRSRSSSKNEDTSNIDLPTCSTANTQTLTVQRNGAEMLFLLASPSSSASSEVSPIFNRRRNLSTKGGESSDMCNGQPRSVSEVRELPVHIPQSATPDLSTVGSYGVPCHSPADIQEVEELPCPSLENGVSSLGEGELFRRSVTTPTGRRMRLFSPPPMRLRSPPYSPDEQSSEGSIERRHSVSSMEKSMLLHLYDEMQRDPPSEDGILTKEYDRDSAGNDSICVDGSHSSSDSEDLDAERKDTDAEVVAEGFGLQITRGDLATLSGTNWLNDKIVNFYLKLLTERGRQNREPEVYAYDTFFFPKLIKCGFQSVKKWTRVVDVFKHDILIIPVHLGTHWCMTSVDFRKQTIVYYDSMGGQNESCLKTIWNYLHQECVERSVEPLSEEVWQLRCAKDIPMQKNNSDCGVFMCKYAECITRDAELEFSQSDMPAIRMDMMEEIRTMNLLHH